MCKNLGEDVGHLLQHCRVAHRLCDIMLNEFHIQLAMPAAVKVKCDYFARDLEGIKEKHGVRSGPFSSTHVNYGGKVIGVSLEGRKILPYK